MRLEFSTLKNSVIKHRIVIDISDTKKKERFLRISDLTLEKAIVVVRSAEATEIQLRDLANDSAVHGIGVPKKYNTTQKDNLRQRRWTQLKQDIL